jgi:hypothetical protein
MHAGPARHPFASRPVFTQCMDDAWRRLYDQLLVTGFISDVRGLPEALD